MYFVCSEQTGVTKTMYPVFYHQSIRVCVCVCVCVCMYVCIYVCKLSIYVSVCLPLCVCMCLSVCLSIYLSIYLSVRPSIHPSIHPCVCVTEREIIYFFRCVIPYFSILNSFHFILNPLILFFVLIYYILTFSILFPSPFSAGHVA